ncbi:MAG: hypothetical protein IPI67_23985 [Myxococcales bacterium]|nr:hypothetical protein [Myxococcales bacterium]
MPQDKHNDDGAIRPLRLAATARRMPEMPAQGAGAVMESHAAPEGGLVVSSADPRAMFTMVDNPAVEPVAGEADERLRRVIDPMGGKEAV